MHKSLLLYDNSEPLTMMASPLFYSKFSRP